MWIETSKRFKWLPRQLTKVVPDDNIRSISALPSHRLAENSRWIVLSFMLLSDAKYELMSWPIQLSLFGNLLSSAGLVVLRWSARRHDWVVFPHLSIPKLDAKFKYHLDRWLEILKFLRLEGNYKPSKRMKAPRFTDILSPLAEKSDAVAAIADFLMRRNQFLY